MKCLWLTRQFPRPAISGDLLYGANLIDNLALTGADLTIVGLEPPAELLDGARASPSGPGAQTWIILPRRSTPAALSLASPLPSASFRLATPDYRRTVRDLLQRDWDVVVANHISMGWVSGLVRKARRGGRRVPFVFVTHNHEASVKASVAKAFEGGAAMKAALRYDAWKNLMQEARTVGTADAITTITEDDRALFLKDFPDKTILPLEPGYEGDRIADRLIDGSTPRRAVVLGALEWIGKQQNLRTFLRAADERFSAAGVEVEVVGKASQSFIDEISSWCRCARFTGPVPDFRPNLAAGRIGLMPDTVGGGFKHKNLNYVYNGLPLACIGDQTKGLPLVPQEDFIAAETPESLTSSILDAIDDLPRLNRMQRSAAQKCAGLFSWPETGRKLRALLDQLAGSKA